MYSLSGLLYTTSSNGKKLGILIGEFHFRFHNHFRIMVGYLTTLTGRQSLGQNKKHMDEVGMPEALRL